MFLKEIVINGFKSFADKTNVQLPRGITCIVGPNGCGKSNIVDAIRWVLGEQSAKALRGGKMQDVIFQGTDKRKALQFCDVSLLFSDCENQLGTNFNEVEIARKVTRDGGSEYFINGKASRLKDVQNLFMDTGIGRVSYSFMVQGQIDQILSSNPGERRSIFEEAAGITKYKTQRREALNKLTLVDQNLARVTDRVEEIGRQIGTLKRQASKALRYKRLSHRLRHLDLALNGKVYKEHSVEIEKGSEILAKLSRDYDEFARVISEKDDELSRMRGIRAGITSTLEQMRSESTELRSEKEQSQSKSEFASIRRKDLVERQRQVVEETGILKGQLESLIGKVQGDMEIKQAQLNLVSGSDETFLQFNSEIQEIESGLRGAEGMLYSLKQDLLVQEGGITRLRSNCTTHEVDLKSYQVRHAAISDMIFQSKEERGVTVSKVEEMKEAFESGNERLAVAEADTQEAINVADKLRQEYRDQQVKIQVMDRQLAGKAARLSLLNDFQKRLEGFSDGVKAILQGKISDVLNPDEVTVVSQSVEVVEDWRFAFESMLGNSVDAISLEDSNKLESIIGLIRSKGLGKACIKVRDISEFDEVSNLPEGIYKGSDFVKAEAGNEKLERVVSEFLRGCYFCESLGVFKNYILEKKGFKFALAVSRGGDIMDSRGIVFISSGEKSDTESSIILRSSEIKRLKGEVEKDNEDLTKLNEEAMVIQSKLEVAEMGIESSRGITQEIKREISSIEVQKRNLDIGLKEKDSEISRMETQLMEMENSKFEAEDKLKKAKEELSTVEGLIVKLKEDIVLKERDIEFLRAEKEQKSSVLSELRLDLAEKRARLEHIEKNLSAIGVQQEELNITIERRESENKVLGEQIDSLERESIEESEKAKALGSKLEFALKGIEDQRLILNDCERKVVEFEEFLNVERSKQNRLYTEKSEVEMKLTKLRSKSDFIAERSIIDYETDIASIDWKMELWRADEEFEVKVKLDELEEGEVSAKPKKSRGEPSEEDFEKMDSFKFSIFEEEVKELRERINSMGAVNLVAIEEYVELKERYDFLTSQSEDLWKSKNELVSAIDEINATSQKMFTETFEQIRKNFEFTFQKLFGGGTADLKLVESEDVLDSGIEIIARPPGTVLKSLSLLSGGQRTMTAVALLFAIYMVKPSPFCVLDELDAPLDDANIGRYTDIVKEFTKYSQFLIVTHSKKTVSVADTIYGVTMQERGVTKLVSMRFNRDTEDFS